jgi:choline dehydrogenase
VHDEAIVLGLDLEGKRANGITYRRYRRVRQVAANCEVILAAGAINSPQLLQISGIGAASHLKQIGVNPVHNLAGVGEGLQDHYAVRVSCAVKNATSLNERGRGLRLLWEIAHWYAAGKGLIAYSPAHVGAFVRSHPDLTDPDLQFVFTPASYTDGAIGELQKTPGMTCGIWQMRPESKGYVRARSTDPEDPPAIQPNYLATEGDQRAIVEGLKWCRRFLATDALAPYRGDETLPGPAVDGDAALLAYARQKGGTVYHAVSTCRMGSDPAAVVDSSLRVHGIDRLRVIDASVMPTMPSANTNAATLMIAEKGADLVLQDYRAARAA